MDCPTCHIPMSHGDITLEQTLKGIFLGGSSSYLEMFFRQTDQEPVPVMNPWEIRAGFRCRTCQIVVVTTREGTQHTRTFSEDTESECLACRAAMAPGIITCPACGWTYKTTEPN